MAERARLLDDRQRRGVFVTSPAAAEASAEVLGLGGECVGARPDRHGRGDQHGRCDRSA
ncbi:MAG: hypothetical protein R2706_01290 [Acidimicrobiales bacterium]